MEQSYNSQAFRLRKRGSSEHRLLLYTRFLCRPLLPDPADDMVLETAVNGRADLLVTFNQKDFAAVAEGFAFKILRPSEALHRLRALAKE